MANVTVVHLSDSTPVFHPQSAFVLVGFFPFSLSPLTTNIGRDLGEVALFSVTHTGHYSWRQGLGEVPLFLLGKICALDLHTNVPG